MSVERATFLETLLPQKVIFHPNGCIQFYIAVDQRTTFDGFESAVFRMN